jgi:outer membrane protein
MKKSILIVSLAIISLSLNAQKVGYINSQAIISELPEVMEANSSIEALKAQLVKKGQEMIQALQQKGQKLEAEKNAMAPIKFQEEVDKLKKEEQEIVTFEEQSQFKIMQKSEFLLGPIQKKMNEVIKTIAKENGYSYVFDTGAGNILYSDEKADLSALVKAKMKL